MRATKKYFDKVQNPKIIIEAGMVGDEGGDRESIDNAKEGTAETDRMAQGESSVSGIH